MTDSQEVTFLCGVVKPDSKALLSLGIVRLKNDPTDCEVREIKVSPNDPGLSKIIPGRRRMAPRTDAFVNAAARAQVDRYSHARTRRSRSAAASLPDTRAPHPPVRRP